MEHTGDRAPSLPDIEPVKPLPASVRFLLAAVLCLVLWPVLALLIAATLLSD
jgi:hypothetical protein